MYCIYKHIVADSKSLCDYKEHIKYFNRKTSSKCLEGWHFHAAQCFYKSNNTLPWELAKQHCLQLGGNLASIRDNSTNILVGNVGPIATILAWRQ